jgi:hypothetical protein
MIHVILGPFGHGPVGKQYQRKPKEKKADMQHKDGLAPRRIDVQPAQYMAPKAGEKSNRRYRR